MSRARRLPAYLRIRQYVLDLIKESDTEPALIPSERELCRIHNVSRPTVRQAIGTLVEEGILLPQRGLGTFVNKDAISGRKKRANPDATVGMMIFSAHAFAFQVALGFAWGVLQGAAEALIAGGKRVMMTSVQSNGLLAAEEVAAHGIAGVIWIGPSPENVDTMNCLRSVGIPVIAVNRVFSAERHHYVTCDHHAGGYIAADRLLGMGHRDILFVSTAPAWVIKERYNGFLAAHKKRNVTHCEALTVSASKDAYTEVRKKIRNGPKFTGIFVSDGNFLSSVVHAIKDEGRSVPGDYSVIAFDTQPESPYPGIKFVRVAQPLKELGQAAADGMIGLLNGETGLIARTIEPCLLEGDSCRELP